MVVFSFGRSEGIRTPGLMDPNHARYQTSPHPDNLSIIMNKTCYVKSASLKYLSITFDNHVRRPGSDTYCASYLSESFHKLHGGGSMSYQINYGLTSRPIKNSAKNKPWGLTWIVLLVFLLLVNSCWPRGHAVLRDLLWPGEPEKTQQALETFVTQLRYGEPVTDAIELFCLEILEHEGVH